MQNAAAEMTITTIGWWGAYPEAGDATSSFLLQAESRNVLIDCGSGVLSSLQRHVGLEALDAVFLSHYHWDHAGDVGCLQYAARILMDLGKRKNPLVIYADGRGPDFPRLHYLSYCEGRCVSADEATVLGGLSFRFSPNDHPDPSYSMRIETPAACLVYITDTGWYDELTVFAREADLLICESSLYDEYRGRIAGHLSAGEAGRIAAEAGAKRLVLTHLPHWGEHRRLLEQARRVYAGPAELAAAGRSWRLGA
jgi:ribonuclease BN (tRNA processing enzyme)